MAKTKLEVKPSSEQPSNPFNAQSVDALLLNCKLKDLYGFKTFLEENKNNFQI